MKLYLKIIKKGGALIIALSLFVSCQKNIQISTINTNNSLNQVKTEQPDKPTLNQIEPYKQQLSAKMDEVIGYSNKELQKDSYQSELGNFIIDLILKESEKAIQKNIDMALVTNGGLRTPIPKGNITVGNIFELMPFDNQIVVLELTGETVLKMMHYAAFKGNAVFAGVKYKVKNGQTDNIIIGGEGFNFDTTYTLAVSDYLANGGDNMHFLKEAIAVEETNLLFRDAIINHIKILSEKGKNIEGVLDDRVLVEE